MYFTNMSRDQLRVLAKEHQIRGRGAMNKEQLLQAIQAVHCQSVYSSVKAVDASKAGQD